MDSESKNNREETKLESSITILLSLYIMIEQNYTAMVYYMENIDETSENRRKLLIPPKRDLFVDEAITESLFFQIILKICSFIEEWDTCLGVLNEDRYLNKLILIKKVVKPATEAFKNWKDIRKFRNEIIAHNFRKNKSNNITLFDINKYDIPQSAHELSVIVSILDRMLRVLIFNFPIVYKKACNETLDRLLNEPKFDKTKESAKDWDKVITEIDLRISDNIWSIVKFDMIESLVRQIRSKKS